jgi:hypothetical protein
VAQPIIYIRGYAGPTSGINAQVVDPFYGFNKGATHVRVGVANDPVFYQFEGPMLRLMIDHDYKLLVRGDQHAYLDGADDGTVEPKSIWVYRFYDQAATTFARQPHENLFQRAKDIVHQRVTSDGFNIEKAAEGLYDLIKLVQSKVKGDDTKVILVAHSMGGLIARCMMQKITMEDDRTQARELVAKLFTYGTPHGGIAFESAAMDWFEDVLGPAGSDIFAPEKMREYLLTDEERHTAGDHWDPRVVPDEAFDLDNIFCLVGTDPKDYGVSKIVVGPRSDGLVRIENAYVPGAHRAYVYKSHSGSYGEVNSEEGYQNLQRFLFGRWKILIELVDLKPDPDITPDINEAWQADLRLSIRGMPVVITEQRADQYSALQLSAEQIQVAGHEIPLLTTFLLDPAEQAGSPNSAALKELERHDWRARYSLTLRLNKIVERNDAFFFANHLEQVFDWADSIVFDIKTQGDGLQAWCRWTTELSAPIDKVEPIAAQPVGDIENLGNGQWRFTKELPKASAKIPIFSDQTRLRVTATDRTHNQLAR